MLAGCVTDAEGVLTLAPNGANGGVLDPAAADRAEAAFYPTRRPDPSALGEAAHVAPAEVAQSAPGGAPPALADAEADASPASTVAPITTIAETAAPVRRNARAAPAAAGGPNAAADLAARLRPAGVAPPAARQGEAPLPGVVQPAPIPGATALAALSPPKAAFRPAGQDQPLDRLIARYSAEYGVPETLVRRVVKRESGFNPAAFNRGHWGLMQIKHQTAQGMGYRGPAKGLLDAETNLKYAVKYLRGAWLVAGGNHDRADRFYQTGYYYDAKRMGLLDETGLGRDRVRKRKPG